MLNNLKNKLRQYWPLVITALVFITVIPLLFILFEYRVTLFDELHAFGFLQRRPLMFIYNCFLLLLFGLLFATITKSFAIGGGLLAIGLYILSFIQMQKLEIRGFNLLPHDFILANQAESMVHFAKWFDLLRLFIISALIFMFSIHLHRLIKKSSSGNADASSHAHSNLEYLSSTEENSSQKGNRRHLARPMQITLLIALIVVIKFATWPLLGIEDPKNNNIERALANSIRPHMIFLHNNTSYYSNGFLVDFIHGARIDRMIPPDGYSKKAIERIVAKYQAVSEKNNQDRLDLSDDSISIIFLTEESFFDPENIDSLFPIDGGDITPNLHKLQKENDIFSGSLLSPVYGGGTDSVEYEVLTGLSSSFLNMSPYNSVVSHKENFPSLASFLRDESYSSVGMHPYEKGMYERSIVYQNLGFDTFLDKTNFKNNEKHGQSEYISDESAVRELITQIKSGNKQFIHLITMQNHMPYGEVFSTHEYKSKANIDSAQNLIIEDYLENLHDSDKALDLLFKEIDLCDQKIMLVFYGDHLPGIYPGLEDRSPKKSRTTPLLLHANFETAGIKPTSPNTPNFLASDVLNYLNAKKPGFYYFLDDLKKEHPVILKGQESGSSNDKLLEEYRLINYDLVSGEHYSVEMGFYK